MGDFEDVEGAGVDRHALRLGVGGEQHREVAPAGEDHKRLQIRVFAGKWLDEAIGRRPEDFESEPPRPHFAALGDADRHRAGGFGAAITARLSRA